MNTDVSYEIDSAITESTSSNEEKQLRNDYLLWLQSLPYELLISMKFPELWSKLQSFGWKACKGPQESTRNCRSVSDHSCFMKPNIVSKESARENVDYFNSREALLKFVSQIVKPPEKPQPKKRKNEKAEASDNNLLSLDRMSAFVRPLDQATNCKGCRTSFPTHLVTLPSNPTLPAKHTSLRQSQQPALPATIAQHQHSSGFSCSQTVQSKSVEMPVQAQGPSSQSNERLSPSSAGVGEPAASFPCDDGALTVHKTAAANMNETQHETESSEATTECELEDM